MAVEQPAKTLGLRLGRVAIILFLLVAISLSWYITGSFLPSDPKQALIFQGSLLLIVLGSAVLEHKFTKPADSAVNALMGIVTIVLFFTPQHQLWRGGSC